MEWYEIFLILFGILIVMLFSGAHVAIAFAFTGIIGFLVFENGVSSLPQIIRLMHDSLFSYGLLAIPLFILMAELLEAAGATRRLYSAINVWFGWLPGSLPATGMLTCGVFGAACGSSIAATASLGKLMLHEMITRGVDKKLAAGTVATGGSLSLLIPPSLALILYGALSNASVGKLFIGALIPGILQVVLFMLYIIIRTIQKPEIAPRSVESNLSFIDIVKSTKWGFAILIAISCVLASIYVGVATPNEAGAVGAFLAILIGLISRELKWSGVKNSLFNTLKSTGFCIFLVLGAQIITRIFALQGGAQAMTDAIVSSGVSSYMVLFFVTIMYIILGMFMDGISIKVLTVPILVPVLVDLGFDIIWLGVYLVILINIGLITPPVGLGAYIVSGIGEPYGIKLTEVFISCMPFLVIMIISAFLVILFPEIITWLPGTM